MNLNWSRGHFTHSPIPKGKNYFGCWEECIHKRREKPENYTKNNCYVGWKFLNEYMREELSKRWTHAQCACGVWESKRAEWTMRGSTRGYTYIAECAHQHHVYKIKAGNIFHETKFWESMRRGIVICAGRRVEYWCVLIEIMKGQQRARLHNPPICY